MAQKLLGKLPAVKDKRNLKLKKYLPKVLPEVPDTARWDKVKPKTKWGMDGNDKYGNCVIVTTAHIIDCAKANESGIKRRIPDNEVIKLSTEMGALDGYYVLERLRWWRNTGMFDTKIEAFVSVDLKNHNLIRTSINMFGHCDIGLNMPAAWQRKKIWDVGEGSQYLPGTWGGHSVPILGYHTRKSDGKIIYSICTWGEIVSLTQDALDYYCDEQYCSILPTWFEQDQVTPSGFNVDKLREDLNKL